MAQIFAIGSVIVFLAAIAVFLLLGWVLNYHWTQYRRWAHSQTEMKNIEKMRLWYFGASLVLLTFMAAAIIFIFL